jgi:hypothetical protein
VAKQAKAALALFTASTSKGKKASEKTSRKEPAKKSSEKENALKKTTETLELCCKYQALYNKAIFAKKTAKNKREATATKMFQFYANLLSLDAKYAWNKIVREQTEADPFKDLQGMSMKGARGLSRESFDKCVMFHLFSVFPNNAAEQEKYYLSNVLKKPQRVGIHQLIQRIEQLNAYIGQLPFWYYSPSYVSGMMPVNVPFAEADLASHILLISPHQWQDQYNLQEKGMTPMDMRSLQASLEAIERVCTHEKTHAPPVRKLLTRMRQDPSSPVMVPQSRLTRKSISRGLASCARILGACILRTLPKTAASMRKMERQKPTSTPPRRQVGNPILQSSHSPN